MRAVKNPVCDTPKASSANAERIERASQKVEKRSRTSRSWFEGVSVERVGKVMPDTVRHCAWQISRRLARPGRAKQNEASRRHNGQVSKITKMNHFTDGEWSLRLWRDAVMVPGGHWRGTLARVCRCRTIKRRPENQRWDRKSLTQINGEPWNTSPRQEENLQIKDRECTALEHSIKCGGHKGSMACCEHAGSNLRDLRARTQRLMDNEVVQTENQRKFECLTRKHTEQFEQGTVQSSNGGTAMAAGRPAPEDSSMRAAAVAESATTQSTTSSRIRVVETEDQSNIECHKVLAGIFNRHETIVDMDTCRAIDKMTDPEDCDGWTQQVVDRNKKCCGAKSGHLGHLFESQKVSKRRIKELANIEKLEVAEITMQETIARATEIVHAGPHNPSGPQPFGPPTLRAPNPSGPQPFGPPTLRDPPNPPTTRPAQGDLPRWQVSPCPHLQCRTWSHEERGGQIWVAWCPGWEASHLEFDPDLEVVI